MRVDLGHSIDRDPIALFDGERMISGFQLDVRAYSVVAQMDTRLQILGARIERQFGREPAEKRSDVSAFRRAEAGNEILKALRTERDPGSPDVGLVRSVDRDLDAATDEKQFAVDHAGVGLQDAAVLSLLLGDPVEI